MAQYSAVIRRKSGKSYTTLVDASGAARAEEIAREIAAAEDGEFVSIDEAPSPEPENKTDG